MAHLLAEQDFCQECLLLRHMFRTMGEAFMPMALRSTQYVARFMLFATFRTVGGVSLLICSFSFFNELCILFRKSDRKSLSPTISRPEMKAFEMCSIAASEPGEREGSAVRTGLTSCRWRLKKSSQVSSFATMWIDFRPGTAPHCSCRASCSLVGRQNWPRTDSRQKSKASEDYQ